MGNERSQPVQFFAIRQKLKAAKVPALPWHAWCPARGAKRHPDKRMSLFDVAPCGSAYAVVLCAIQNSIQPARQ